VDDLSRKIKESLLSKGASLVGFADISTFPTDVRYSLPYAVSIAVAMNASVIANIRSGPTPEYNAETNRVKNLLIDLGKYTASMLKENGFEAISLELSSEDIDWKTLSTSLPFKTVATRAGLGWIGKCATLVTREYGSAVRLFAVLTDAGLDAGMPISISHCGECTDCVKACPAQALSGKDWNVNTNRDEFYNAFACKETAVEGMARLGIVSDHELCGICIAVCPWTQKYISRHESRE
jgi:epoxyqueuosine reductase